MLTLFGLLYPYMGMIYLKGVGYCSLFVAGSPEPYDDNGNSPTLLKQ